MAEGLSEEELAIFDILTKPEPTLTKQEEAEVKKVAQALLQTLKWEKLVLDWRLKQQSCAEVQETIAEVFDTLPATYSKEFVRREAGTCLRAHLLGLRWRGREHLRAGSIVRTLCLQLA